MIDKEPEVYINENYAKAAINLDLAAKANISFNEAYKRSVISEITMPCKCGRSNTGLRGVMQIGNTPYASKKPYCDVCGEAYIYQIDTTLLQ